MAAAVTARSKSVARKARPRPAGLLAPTKPNVDPIHRDGTCGLVISLIPGKPPLSVERRAS
jgi:hypothetical protein